MTDAHLISPKPLEALSGVRCRVKELSTRLETCLNDLLVLQSSHSSNKLSKPAREGSLSTEVLDTLHTSQTFDGRSSGSTSGESVLDFEADLLAQECITQRPVQHDDSSKSGTGSRGESTWGSEHLKPSEQTPGTQFTVSKQSQSSSDFNKINPHPASGWKLVSGSSYQVAVGERETDLPPVSSPRPASGWKLQPASGSSYQVAVGERETDLPPVSSPRPASGWKLQPASGSSYQVAVGERETDVPPVSSPSHPASGWKLQPASGSSYQVAVGERETDVPPVSSPRPASGWKLQPASGSSYQVAVGERETDVSPVSSSRPASGWKLQRTSGSSYQVAATVERETGLKPPLTSPQPEIYQIACPSQSGCNQIVSDHAPSFGITSHSAAKEAVPVSFGVNPIASNAISPPPSFGIIPISSSNISSPSFGIHNPSSPSFGIHNPSSPVVTAAPHSIYAPSALSPNTNQYTSPAGIVSSASSLMYHDAGSKGVVTKSMLPPPRPTSSNDSSRSTIHPSMLMLMHEDGSNSNYIGDEHENLGRITEDDGGEQSELRRDRDAQRDNNDSHRGVKSGVVHHHLNDVVPDTPSSSSCTNPNSTSRLAKGVIASLREKGVTRIYNSNHNEEATSSQKSGRLNINLPQVVVMGSQSVATTSGSRALASQAATAGGGVDDFEAALERRRHALQQMKGISASSPSAKTLSAALNDVSVTSCEPPAAGEAASSCEPPAAGEAASSCEPPAAGEAAWSLSGLHLSTRSVEYGTEIIQTPGSSRSVDHSNQQENSKNTAMMAATQEMTSNLSSSTHNTISTSPVVLGPLASSQSNGIVAAPSSSFIAAAATHLTAQQYFLSTTASPRKSSTVQQGAASGPSLTLASEFFRSAASMSPSSSLPTSLALQPFSSSPHSAHGYNSTQNSTISPSRSTPPRQSSPPGPIISKSALTDCRTEASLSKTFLQVENLSLKALNGTTMADKGYKDVGFQFPSRGTSDAGHADGCAGPDKRISLSAEALDSDSLMVQHLYRDQSTTPREAALMKLKHVVKRSYRREEDATSTTHLPTLLLPTQHEDYEEEGEGGGNQHGTEHNFQGNCMSLSRHGNEDLGMSDFQTREAVTVMGLPLPQWRTSEGGLDALTHALLSRCTSSEGGTVTSAPYADMELVITAVDQPAGENTDRMSTSSFSRPLSSETGQAEKDVLHSGGLQPSMSTTADEGAMTWKGTSASLSHLPHAISSRESFLMELRSVFCTADERTQQHGPDGEGGSKVPSSQLLEFLADLLMVDQRVQHLNVVAKGTSMALPHGASYEQRENRPYHPNNPSSSALIRGTSPAPTAQNVVIRIPTDPHNEHNQSVNAELDTSLAISGIQKVPVAYGIRHPAIQVSEPGHVAAGNGGSSTRMRRVAPSHSAPGCKGPLLKEHHLLVDTTGEDSVAASTAAAGTAAARTPSPAVPIMSDHTLLPSETYFVESPRWSSNKSSNKQALPSGSMNKDASLGGSLLDGNHSNHQSSAAFDDEDDAAAADQLLVTRRPSPDSASSAALSPLHNTDQAVEALPDQLALMSLDEGAAGTMLGFHESPLFAPGKDQAERQEDACGTREEAAALVATLPNSSPAAAAAMAAAAAAVAAVLIREMQEASCPSVDSQQQHSHGAHHTSSWQGGGQQEEAVPGLSHARRILFSLLPDEHDKTAALPLLPPLPNQARRAPGGRQVPAASFPGAPGTPSQSLHKLAGSLPAGSLSVSSVSVGGVQPSANSSFLKQRASNRGSSAAAGHTSLKNSAMKAVALMNPSISSSPTHSSSRRPLLHHSMSPVVAGSKTSTADSTSNLRSATTDEATCFVYKGLEDEDEVSNADIDSPPEVDEVGCFTADLEGADGQEGQRLAEGWKQLMLLAGVAGGVDDIVAEHEAASYHDLCQAPHPGQERAEELCIDENNEKRAAYAESQSTTDVLLVDQSGSSKVSSTFPAGALRVLLEQLAGSNPDLMPLLDAICPPQPLAAAAAFSQGSQDIVLDAASSVTPYNEVISHIRCAGANHNLISADSARSEALAQRTMLSVGDHEDDDLRPGDAVPGDVFVNEADSKSRRRGSTLHGHHGSAVMIQDASCEAGTNENDADGDRHLKPSSCSPGVSDEMLRSLNHALMCALQVLRLSQAVSPSEVVTSSAATSSTQLMTGVTGGSYHLLGSDSPAAGAKQYNQQQGIDSLAAADSHVQLQAGPVSFKIALSAAASAVASSSPPLNPEPHHDMGGVADVLDLEGDEDISWLRDQAMMLLTFRHWRMQYQQGRLLSHSHDHHLRQLAPSNIEAANSGTNGSSGIMTSSRTHSPAAVGRSESGRSPSRLNASPLLHPRVSTSPVFTDQQMHTRGGSTRVVAVNQSAASPPPAAERHRYYASSSPECVALRSRPRASDNVSTLPAEAFSTPAVTISSDKSNRISTVTTRATDYLFSSLRHPSALTSKREVAQQLLQKLGALTRNRDAFAAYHLNSPSNGGASETHAGSRDRLITAHTYNPSYGLSPNTQYNPSIMITLPVVTGTIASDVPKLLHGSPSRLFQHARLDSGCGDSGNIFSQTTGPAFEVSPSHLFNIRSW
ncbi:hypothetical protein CEUSTIGMA_g5793.t1 [Chlamydomonas eustigma]|uniref:Uncharacterized protein n=1 Tax=Chlamydomonas eustigma TaxID=1157962 RepID=A0A250X5J7_9CHLO|nr:hypothetical protein CEUSTIGMA_g5793.t1 [Chlamydomonas eustigma]|eukprot:GAX78351.1 hypothetical protein CEUSTIGMA_g5793.t1 [Chlamydomonas eustigma]